MRFYPSCDVGVLFGEATFSGFVRVRGVVMEVFSLVDGGEIERRGETSRRMQTERACVCA